MQAFEYASPATLKDALSLLGSSWSDAAVLAGGTDLINLMKEYIETPKRVVNIKGIKELGGVTKTGNGVRIGALASFDDLANSALIRAQYPSIHAAVRGVASPQIRNMGTAGGDLLQRPRCWYYRNGNGLLAMKEGKSLVPQGQNQYHAIFGGGPAYFVSASSLGPALIALGAKVTLQSASGPRTISAEELFVVPQTENDRETAVKPGEILTEIVLPVNAAVKNSTYEIREREALDWPLATASVALTMKGANVGDARVVLGHVAPKPWVATEAQTFLAGKSISEEVAEQAGAAAVKAAAPLTENGYKVQLAKVAVKRALLAAAGKQV
ncbi:MAG TPA: xanthine dehydrogenase family protein subunit M [Bryobacteraceae bacterium]|nr:xanthine dehydrogenase family protein subunit M [Bryobacteraceae bacterium]